MYQRNIVQIGDRKHKNILFHRCVTTMSMVLYIGTNNTSHGITSHFQALISCIVLCYVATGWMEYNEKYAMFLLEL